MPTILVVEDEFAIAELLKEVLTDGGYDVRIASNGQQGFERLAQGARPDLVICDFMMPVMDGARMLRAIRDKEEYRDIPCIMISSLPEANVREAADCYRAFLRKPFPLRTLLELVAIILSKFRGPPAEVNLPATPVLKTHPGSTEVPRAASRH